MSTLRPRPAGPVTRGCHEDRNPPAGPNPSGAASTRNHGGKDGHDPQRDLGEPYLRSPAGPNPLEVVALLLCAVVCAFAFLFILYHLLAWMWVS